MNRLTDCSTTIATFSLITVEYVGQEFSGFLITLDELVERCPDFFKLMRFVIRKKAYCR